MAHVSSRQSDALAVPTDDLDDLFDYDVNMDDVLRDVDPNMDAPAEPKIPAKNSGKENAIGLGIDEEIKVVKQRKPVPKLDEARLLSQAGIPKLRRLARERLKFRGKGHEYSDVARLLNVYQFWLDDLYPRAKFADGLAMIEKLGHSKRMQTMRKEWINEGKPKETIEDISISTRKDSIEAPSTSKPDEAPTSRDPTARLQTPAADATNDDDLYSATPRIPSSARRQLLAPGDSLFISDDGSGDHPPDDDLDLLLAEDSMNDFSARPTANDHRDGRTERVSRADNFDDEMEAMAGMDGIW